MLKVCHVMPQEKFSHHFVKAKTIFQTSRENVWRNHNKFNYVNTILVYMKQAL